MYSAVKSSKIFRLIVGPLVGAFVLAGCGGNISSGAKHDQATQTANYNRLVAGQPAHTMNYSPTRNAINGWIDTWGKPGALSYVYLQNSEGKLINHYVFKGLPVSYCAALTPTQRTTDPNGDGNAVLNNPSIDGVYYSGGQCNTYYGFDATTGAYVEYTVGIGNNVLLFNKPLPQSNVTSLVPSK